eukprot:11170530-Karenia_brevis.AAC.1
MSTVVARSPVLSTSVAAQHKVESTLLDLVREIRGPRAYVGYYGFALVGLLRKCCPYIWEGDSLVDIIDTFAPWATEDCPTQCQFTAIACT